MEYENTAGSLKISSEVVASIAEYAVKEVEGVACLAPHRFQYWRLAARKADH